MADGKKDQELSPDLDTALARIDDLYARSTSVAKELGSDYQAESLMEQEPITENFQDKADPTYSAQVEAMSQGDLEKAEGTDEGSKMISEDGSRHNMTPPSEMREGADRASFNDRMNADGGSQNDLEDQIAEIEEELEKSQEFDNEQGNSSDYNDEYEP